MPELKNGFNPDWVSPPGDTIADLIEEKGWTQAELATRLGCTEKHLSQLINGKVTLTTDVAMDLERVLGPEVDFWLAREANYQKHKARLEAEENYSSWTPWLDKLPIRELMSIDAIPTLRNVPKNKTKIVESCLKYFCVASPDEWDEQYGQMQFQFRRSTAKKADIGAISAWLRLGEIKLESTDLNKYDRRKFESTLFDIRAMTRQSPEDFLPTMTRLLGEAGVCFVVVPAIPRAKVSGIARWISPTKAVIQLSLYGKSNDKFWFTFFHEAAHILLHADKREDKKSIFLDEFNGDDSTNTQEHEANTWAANFLIPEEYHSELRLLDSENDIVDFAERLTIHPGIVIGRLQHEKIKPFSYCNHLKETFNVQN